MKKAGVQKSRDGERSFFFLDMCLRNVAKTAYIIMRAYCGLPSFPRLKSFREVPSGIF